MLDAIANRNFRWLFDAALDAQLICNQHGDIAVSNPAAQTLFGRSLDQLSRLRIDELIDPIDAFESITDTLSGAILHARSGVAVRARTNREPPGQFESAFSPLDDAWILVSLHPSEPRHAQRALDEHQQRLATLIDASPDYIYFKDGAGRWQIANRAALDLFRLGGIDYQGKTDTELAELAADCYRDALGYCSESDEAAWRHGEITRSIEIVTTASGDCRQADVYKIPLFEPDGQRKALVILGRDITELEQARESLKASERFLSELLDAAPDCIMFKDAEGRYRFANTATSDTVGIEPELLLGKTDRELAAELPDLRSTLRHCEVSDELAWQAHGPTRSLETVTMDDGGQRQIEFIKAPLFHPDGARKGLILFGRDMTDKLAAERALIESRERLAFAIKGGALGTWDWDLTTHALRFDDDWLRALGYAPGEVSGSLSGCASLCHPDDYPVFEKSWNDYLSGITEYFHVELRVRTRQGEWNWYLSGGAARAAPRTGTPYQKKQVASLTAAAIAHELNQPLNAVAGYSDAALRLLEIGNPRPERLEHALRQGSIQAHRAGQTMRDLLTLLHDGDTEMTALDLNQLIRHAAESLRADDQLGGHVIVTDLDEALPAVLANRIQIEKVLSNLVGNGVDAMHAAGIEQGQIRIGNRDLGDRIEISVHDDGPGVDPRVVATLFEPFHTTKSGGLGMGLAVSRSMIRAHGGELWLDTSNDAGALFKFTLPYQA